jgi:hypothetical protein
MPLTPLMSTTGWSNFGALRLPANLGVDRYAQLGTVYQLNVFQRYAFQCGASKTGTDFTSPVPFSLNVVVWALSESHARQYSQENRK